MAKRSLIIGPRFEDVSPNAELDGRSEHSEDSLESEGMPGQFLEKFAWSESRRCWICSQRLSKVLGRRRHHCRHCGNSVCGEHSSVRKILEGRNEPVRICDRCNKELTNKEFNSGLLADIALLEEELARISLTMQEQKQQLETASAEAEKQLSEVAHVEAAAADSKKSLETRIKDESAQLLKNREVAETLRKAVSDSEAASDLLRENCRDTQQKVTLLASELAHDREQMRWFQDRIERGSRLMHSRISLAEISKVMCEDCTKRLAQSSLSDSTILTANKRKSSTLVDRKVCVEDCSVM